MKNIKFIKPTKPAKLPYWLFSLPKKCKNFLIKYSQEYCPHCGYYCTGKTGFCTKRRINDIQNNRKDKEVLKGVIVEKNLKIAELEQRLKEQKQLTLLSQNQLSQAKTKCGESNPT